MNTQPKAVIHLHLELRRGHCVALASSFLVCALAVGLRSESITLTTSYPSPAGIYRSLITTLNTTLARDGGNVGVGTSAPRAPAPNGGSSGNLDVNDVYFRSTGRWATQSMGPTFISPVLVFNGRGTTPWRTFNASGHVPAGAKAVILAASGSSAGGSYWCGGYSYIRKDAASPSLQLLYTGFFFWEWPRVSGIALGGGSQGTFPIADDRTFQFRATNYNESQSIRLIGYF